MRRVRTALMLTVAVVAACLGCGSDKLPSPTPVTVPVSRTLSGQVFEVLPGGRIPAANIPVLVAVVTTTGCQPCFGCPGPCIGTTRVTYENTATGADGRYHFSNLPEGWAVLHAYSGTLRQMCAASATLESTTQLDVEVTSAADPQPSKAPLTITGQIYETTAAGRVGVGGAGIEIQWANDGLLLQVFPDASGHYTACGIPANRPIAFWTLPPSYDVYDSPYTWHQFSTDATLDIELKRSH